MKVTKGTLNTAIERIVDAYLDNDIYEDRVKYILRQYFYDEDYYELQIRLDEIERDVRWLMHL